jgi:glycosyltransferase involved in cell wall biosynthesis
MGQRGGLEVVLINVLKALDRLRFTPAVALLEDGPFANEIRNLGVETWVIESGRARNVVRAASAIARLIRLIKREEIDVVHTMNSKAHVYGGSAAALCKVPCIYHLHGVPRFRLTRDGILSLLSVLVPARRTVACSAYVAGAFERAWLSRRQALVVRNGVVSECDTMPNGPAVRQDFRIPEKAPLVVMVTRLQRWKGVHVFLDAAARVINQIPEARFMIVGGALFGLEQDYAAELHERVKSLKLGDAVRFVGFRSDVFTFYSAADLVVHCSIEPEPFGMVLLEAMACGKPVVASDSGGPREIVLNGATGLLVPPNDAAGLARAVLTLLDDPERSVRMGQAGATRVREHFSAARMVRQLQAIYGEIIR